MGGDASLLHLASLIDAGIRMKEAEKETPSARKYRKIHKVLKPLRYAMLVVYVLLT